MSIRAPMATFEWKDKVCQADYSIKWNPPTPESIMLNTDATFRSGTEHGTIAEIFKDCTGAWLLGFINQVSVSDPLEVEIHALLFGLSIALEYTFLTLEM
ncbi:hypothetical protein CQW23_03821 [Capsicum baccatum]|uniref:RNase H type-1 domain-containing protein n=1 Tax=Capsicum baccatum TaxID=33114 RepID=A0A2G2XCX7_CAPBA|nr:hypothetical protein CQW23_03821 [Capsicum baccatum]